MIKAIIVDDEQHCINRLSRLLNENCAQSVNVLGAYMSGGAALEAIDSMEPDLVFMDIQLGDMLGIDLLKLVPEVKFDVIFTTAYDNYAIQAFKFSAIDYLLKPLAADELVAAINRVEQINDKKQLAKKLDTLFHNLKYQNGNTAKISVPTSTGLVFLNVKDIIRCKADVNYTTIYLKDKTSITVAKTLKEFEGMLTPHDFYRIHSAHLINMHSIKSYHRGKGGYIVMHDNTTLEVSSRKKYLFLKAMGEL
jgi:two-component system LytT family response regulator